MSNVIKFPVPPKALVRRPSPVPARHDRGMSKLQSNVLDGLRVVLALVWPILRWLLAIDVAWQFFRMLYYWDTPGAYAGWIFVIHFVAFVAITYFVSSQRPGK